jgi:hypothetical protein
LKDLAKYCRMHDMGERLTRAQRREAERLRQQQIDNERSQNQTKKRRTQYATLGISLVLGGLGLAAVLYSPRNSLNILGASSSPTSTREDNLRPAPKVIYTATPASDSTVLANEIARLGISFDPEEEKIVSQYYFEAAKPSIPINDTTREIALDRVVKEFNFLGSSRNIDFNRAYHTLGPISTERRLPLQLINTISSSGISGDYVPLSGTYAADYQTNRMLYPTSVSVYDVLNTVNTMDLATNMVFMAEMVRAFEDINQRNIGLPLRQRLELINRTLDDRNVAEGLEARAYGRSIQAYIREVGLLGRSRNSDSRIGKWAIAFIKLGSNVDSREWVEYVRREIQYTLPNSPSKPTTPPKKLIQA